MPRSRPDYSGSQDKPGAVSTGFLLVSLARFKEAKASYHRDPE